MTLQNLYNKTVNVLRITKTSADDGSWTEAEVVHIYQLPCRINWLRGSERVMFSKDTWFRDAKVYCAVVDILNKDRISYDSKTYEVVNVSNPDEMNKYMIVEMRLIE